MSTNTLNTTAQLWELGNFIGNFLLLKKDGVIISGLKHTVTISMVNDTMHIQTEDDFHRLRTTTVRKDGILKLIASQSEDLRPYDHREQLLEFIISRLALQVNANKKSNRTQLVLLDDAAQKAQQAKAASKLAVNNKFRSQRRARRWKSLKDKLAVPTKMPLNELEKAVEKDPNNVALQRELGFTYFRMHRHAEAADLLSQISGQQEYFVKASGMRDFWLALARSHLYAFYENPTSGRSRMEPALMAYQRCTKELQNIINPNIWLELGVVYMQLGAYELAAQTFMRVICHFTTFSHMNEVVFLTAVMLHMLHQHTKSVLMLRFILADPPPPYELADIHFVLGRVLSHGETADSQQASQRHLKKSFALLKQTHDVGLNRSWKKWYKRDAWSYFGTRFACNRDYTLAADCFQQLCDLDGSYPSDWLFLATAFVNTNRSAEAVAYLKKAIRRFPQDGDLKRLLSKCEEMDWTRSYDSSAGSLAMEKQKSLQNKLLNIQAADETLHGKSGLRERFNKRKKAAAAAAAAVSSEGPKQSTSRPPSRASTPGSTSDKASSRSHDDGGEFTPDIDLLTISPDELQSILTKIAKRRQKMNPPLASPAKAETSIHTIVKGAPADADYQSKIQQGETAVNKLQSHFHRRKARKQHQARIRGANQINRVARGHLSRSKFRQLSSSAAEIQKVQRARLARRRVQNLREEKAAADQQKKLAAAKVVQRNVRMLKSKKEALAKWRETHPEIQNDVDDRWFIAELFNESTPSEKQLAADFRELKSCGYLDGGRSRLKSYWSKVLRWGLRHFGADFPDGQGESRLDEGEQSHRRQEFQTLMARITMRAPRVPATHAFCALCEMQGVFQDALDKLMGQGYASELALVCRVIDVGAFMAACGWGSDNQQLDSPRPETSPVFSSFAQKEDEQHRSSTAPAPQGQRRKRQGRARNGKSKSRGHHKADSDASSTSTMSSRSVKLPWQHLKGDKSRRFLPKVKGTRKGRRKPRRRPANRAQCKFSKLVDAAFSNTDLPTILGQQRTVAVDEWGVSPVLEAQIARPSNRLRSFNREQLSMTWEQYQDAIVKR